MKRYAHTAKRKGQEDWHELEAHLAGAAALARNFAEAFGAGEWGECAGRLHDAGKARRAFQEYLKLCAEGRGVRGSAPHAVYGAKLAADGHKVSGKLLAYAISGHHGGLPDWKDLERRLLNFPGLDEITQIGEGVGFPQGFPFKLDKGDKPGFALAFFTRIRNL